MGAGAAAPTPNGRAGSKDRLREEEPQGSLLWAIQKTTENTGRVEGSARRAINFSQYWSRMLGEAQRPWRTCREPSTT